MFRTILLVGIISCFISCDKPKDNYESFVSKFTTSLTTSNSQNLKKMFGERVIIWGFGETSYSLNNKNDFNGYSQKKGELYNALFVSGKMKSVFAYDFPCFSEAFKKQKTITKGKTNNLRFIWIVLNQYRYEFTIEQQNGSFVVTGMRLQEE